MSGQLELIIEDDSTTLVVNIEDNLVFSIPLSTTIDNQLTRAEDGYYVPPTSWEDVGDKPNSTTEEIDDAVSRSEQNASSIEGLEQSKVDKVVGKELSSNDFTDQLRDKLEELENFDDSVIQAELDDKVDKVSGMGLSELSFTTADKNSLDQSEQDRHTHANKSVIDDLSDNAGALEYRGLPVSDQAAMDAKVDKVAGYSLVADDEIAKLLTVEQDAEKNTVNSVAGKQGDVLLDKEDVGLGAVDNTADADKPVSTAVAAVLAGKVDKVAGKQLSDENYTLAEKQKLGGIADDATKNRADSENADKVHTHDINDVTGLSTRLDDIDALIGDVESVLIAINGEP